MTTPRFDVPLPRRMAGLPRDARGWVVPWFVDWRNGEPIFPVMSPDKWRRAVNHRRCWICGEPLGRVFNFIIGPMCAINRVTSEPPSHRDCAEYATKVCPFMVNPRMGRVPAPKIPGGQIVAPGGKHDDGNPGTMLLWPTDDYGVFRTDTGPLLNFAAPTGPVKWWTLGREATAREAADAFQVGAEKLLAVARLEGDDAVVAFTLTLRVARKVLPDPTLIREVVA
jgi:hypothetical protein